jgi:DNA repair photolyase
MNLYRGCQHGCIYCDTRSDCYQIGDLGDLRYKDRALDLLHRDLSRIRNPGTVGTGSMNDPYMPVEGRLKLTRGALKLLSQYAFPVHIITKGTLVYRDVDILQEIGKTYSAVTLTITTSKDDLSRKIEPGAPPSSSRLRALRLLRDRGILAGVIISPILPWISDQVRDLEKLIRLCRDAGTSYVLFWPWMTLRKGQREYFYGELDRLFPGLKRRYIRHFGGGYHAHSTQSEVLQRKMQMLMKELSLPHSIPQYNGPSSGLPAQGELFL